MISAVDIVSKTVSQIESFGSCSGSAKFITIYHHLQIIMNSASTFSSLLGLSTYFFGLGVGIMCNYATIALWPWVPMPAFLFFPGTSLITLLMIHFTVPVMIDVRRKTRKLLAKKRRKVGLNPSQAKIRKYMKMVLRGMSPIAFRAGTEDFTFFTFKISTRSELYKALVEYTINALLSVK
jgi:hypothetical protein